MNILINNVPAIFEIGQYNHVDNSVARDMFVANLNNYGVEGAEFYEGASVDYSVLAPTWQAMPFEEQANAKVECRQFMLDYQDARGKARKEGEELNLYEFMVEWKPVKEEAPNIYLYTIAWEIYNKAMTDGTDLNETMEAYVADDATWNSFTDDRKKAEREWFSYNVVSWDQSLEYAYKTNNRTLFDGILASR